MGKSQDMSAVATTTAGAPAFRLSRCQWLALISAFLRWMFASSDLGTVPELATILARRIISAPRRWLKVRDGVAAKPASHTFFASIFEPSLRRKTIVGVVVASAAMLACRSGLTFLPNRIHQLSSAAAAHHGTDTTVRYAFILMMIGAPLGYLTLIWTLEALHRRMPYSILSPRLLVAPLVLFMTVRQLVRVRAERLASILVLGTALSTKVRPPRDSTRAGQRKPRACSRSVATRARRPGRNAACRRRGQHGRGSVLRRARQGRA
ncbi:hypothetical protein [Paraburkholderia solisilvae]|uniref:Uncharacterized protein n=1 Tax=Paraburkholderia solisilvae TaxID=624376 RepID=A0A6J5DV58_9BURK|nr:hypothetical protein [Paraburkholderia solisilvae]CAB3757171.1 hypothetical protein LMG29739_02628 [Paraburkholderia solisilvae]